MFGHKLTKAWRRRRLLALTGVGAAVATTALVAPPPGTAHAGQLIGNNSGITPDAKSDGVQGFADGPNNAGTFGRNNTQGGIGAFGTAPSGTGVYGESQAGYGVIGQSTSQYGVYGVSGSSYGLAGLSVSSIGIYGSAPGTSGLGVFGNGGYCGVQGMSNSIAVQGYTNGGTAVYGQNVGGAGWAGQFAGNVFVNGSFTVVNGAKSAAVPHPDGTLRRVYCQESPEPYFEDFGEGILTNGRATVALDATFAAIVRTDSYLVFLTEIDGSNGLYVTARTATGFEVRSGNPAGAGGSFAYRIVAKRKDITAPRLDRVAAPVKFAEPPAIQPLLDPSPPRDGTPTATPATTTTPVSSPVPSSTAPAAPNAT